jgi:hypothetical protein
MLDINREISLIKAMPDIGPNAANALDRLQTAVNQVALQTGTDASTMLSPPPKIQAVNVKTDGHGVVHATVEDNGAIQRGIHYFLEYADNPHFFQPHVVHMGASRSVPPFPLPAFDDSGNPQTWHFRAFSSYPGGLPNEPVNFGGDTPTPVSPGGTTRLTLLPSTGSGTAPSDGQRGGQGFGKVLFRAAPGPKRRSG